MEKAPQGAFFNGRNRFSEPVIVKRGSDDPPQPRMKWLEGFVVALWQYQGFGI
ncbi:hypothetical protein [Acidocella sp.]|uniref:hypothetical protein n=1 Tax=Acidocella sp. TaxID=50710 RepID=UPI003D074EA0